MERTAEARSKLLSSVSPTTDAYKPTRKSRQRQKRLDETEIDRLIAGYRTGSTVDQLAARLGCHCQTVTHCLKAQGVRIRSKSLSAEQIQETVRLYEAGLSSAKVGERIGSTDSTVLARLRERGVVIRDAHDRRGPRPPTCTAQTSL